MTTSTKIALAILALTVIQVLLWTTILHFIRRHKGIEPVWSWRGLMGRFLLLALIVTTLSLVPLAGVYLSVVATLIGIKRLSGLDLLSSFMLSFFVGLTLFLLALTMGRVLDVPLPLLPDVRPL